MYREIICGQKFWHILSGLGIWLELQVEQSENDSAALLHTKNWFKVAKYDESYTVSFNIYRYKLMA